MEHARVVPKLVRVPPALVAEGANALATGLKTTAERIFHAMAPGLVVTAEMLEKGAGVLQSAHDMEDGERARVVVQVMLEEGHPHLRPDFEAPSILQAGRKRAAR